MTERERYLCKCISESGVAMPISEVVPIHFSARSVM